VSVQAVAHVVVPAGAYWTVTEETPEPASEAVPLRVKLPESGEPGFVSVALVGAVLSIRPLMVADVVVKPAPSVAIARTS
jgi:hypothetical protein